MLFRSENISEGSTNTAFKALPRPWQKNALVKAVLAPDELARAKGAVANLAKVSGLPAEVGEEYINDILEYPVLTDDEKKQSVVSALFNGDVKAIAKDFAEKSVALGATVGASKALDKLNADAANRAPTTDQIGRAHV